MADTRSGGATAEVVRSPSRLRLAGNDSTKPDVFVTPAHVLQARCSKRSRRRRRQEGRRWRRQEPYFESPRPGVEKTARRYRMRGMQTVSGGYDGTMADGTLTTPSLKLKCDKTVPCTSCKRRGTASICPNGERRLHRRRVPAGRSTFCIRSYIQLSSVPPRTLVFSYVHTPGPDVPVLIEPVRLEGASPSPSHFPSRCVRVGACVAGKRRPLPSRRRSSQSYHHGLEGFIYCR